MKTAELKAIVGRISTFVVMSVVVASCSAAPGSSTASSPAGNPATGVQVSPAPSTTASAPSPAPSFAPESISIVDLKKRGTDTLLEVTAPPTTTFRLGQRFDSSVACITTITQSAAQVDYLVTCPTTLGDVLYSSISDGRFTYTFEKNIDR